MTEPLISPAVSLAGNVREYTVSELSFALKRTVEDAFAFVRVRGEIGKVSRPASGHIYLDLKDDKAVLAAVCWRGTWNRFKIQPEQGLEVICTGKITTFPGQSKYQIVIEHMEPAGVGALMALLEERKKKLAAEGLFDAARKKPLPYIPDVIGVVTSPTGAVIRDILHRLADRFPRHVLIWPVSVQGDKAAGEIAAAIHGFNRLSADGPVPRPDVLIVARGGGSIEDLWAFNEEIVVRAAAASDIPLISAVGHETDTTLIDFAADVRAPTPTAAAEMAVPVKADLIADLLQWEQRLGSAAHRLLRDRRQRLDGLVRGLPKPLDIWALAAQRLDAVGERIKGALKLYIQQRSERLSRTARLSARPLTLHIERDRSRVQDLTLRLKAAVRRRVERHGDRLAAQAGLLRSLSYAGILERGFVLVKDAAGRLVRRAGETETGASVSLQFADGERQARIEGGEDNSSRRKASASRGKDKTPQGSLF